MIKSTSRKKLNKEFFWGAGILGIYFLWFFVWFVRSRFLVGSLTHPYLPEMDIRSELIRPMTSGYFLGTDLYGRSLFEVLSTGLVYSLSVALLVSISCVIIGIIVGYVSVVGGKIIGSIFEMTTNLVFIFPSILIAILVMSFTGQSLKGLFFVLILTGWPGYARIARGETLRVLGLDYVEAARAIGVGKIRMFLKIIVPDILPQILIHFVLGLSGVIISEAALGFLGLGGSTFSWGALLADAKVVLLEAPTITIFVSLVMGGLIVGLNLMGDSLRDYLDPKE
jgi:peptide/nickel transport system permease protein